RSLGFAGSGLLETRLGRPDPRRLIRERLSRVRNAGNRRPPTEPLVPSRNQSFASTTLPEDRWFFLRCYWIPVIAVKCDSRRVVVQLVQLDSELADRVRHDSEGQRRDVGVEEAVEA